MALTRWQPFETDVFRPSTWLPREFRRLVEDFFADTFFAPAARFLEGTWNPAVDIAETDNEYIVAVEVPGMKKDDIKVTLQDNVLTIKGERKKESEAHKGTYHRVERCYGTFERSFTLPSTIKADKIQAKYEDGILKLTLPKAEEVKAKEIPISVS